MFSRITPPAPDGAPPEVANGSPQKNLNPFILFRVIRVGCIILSQKARTPDSMTQER